ncbi:CUB domain-containing protein [Spirosomataceae bacterium TFI 002]|nr:CUB domain-containing protein [Spirosomataceae bacterium TFI 002]
MKTIPEINFSYLANPKPKGVCLRHLVFGIFVFLLFSISTIAQNRQIELVTNGDFSDGRNGFSSDYNWNSSSNGGYDIDNDPNDVNSNYFSFYDHTTGTSSGRLIAANGSTNANDDVWKNNINVTSGQTYTMTVWIKSIYATNPSSIGWFVGGNQVGTTVVANNNWQQLTVTYTANFTGLATFSIRATSGESSGNAFALDDVSITSEVSPTCSGTYYDTGGNNSNYSNNEDYTQTFCAGAGSNIRFSFNQFNVETNWDFLRIYDGMSTSANSLGTFTGTNSPNTVTSSTGCLTFRFTADNIYNRSGWRAAISCVPDPGCGSISSVVINDLSGGADIDITGGATVYAGQLPNNWNIEATKTVGTGSIRFEVTGDNVQSNVENAGPYRMPNDNDPLNWGPGTYNIKITHYSGNSGTGNICDVEQFTLIIDQCAINNFQVSSNSTVCTGANLNLTSSGGGTGATYNWVGPNSFTSTQQNPTLPSVGAAASGVYFATVTNSGCSATASTSVSVTNAPSVSVTSQNANCGLNNGEVTFTFPDESSRTNIEFSTNGGSSYPTYVSDGIGSTTVTNLGPGTYDLWTRWGNDECPVDLPDVTIIRATGTLTKTADPTACSGAATPLSVSLQNAVGSTTYSWSNGLGTGANKTVSPNSSITYSVTGVDSQGCVGTANITVNVNALPVATATANSPVCSGGTINLNSSGGNSYSWVGPNSFSSGFQNPNITIASNVNAGTYTVTVTDANSCSSTAAVNVLINSGLTVTASTPASNICAGTDLNLFSSGATSYSWSGPGGFSSNSQNPVITNATVSRSGTYTITGSNALGCTASATTSVAVTINSPTASNDGPKCEGSTINLSAVGGNEYVWSGPNGFTSNIANPSISNANLSHEGIYTVTVSISGACPVTATTELSMHALPNILVSNTGPVCSGGNITLNASGGTSYVWSGPNGFSSSNQNPSIFNVNNSKTGSYTVTVTNASGCTATATTVVGLSFPSLTVSSDTVLCAGGTINLHATGAVSYAWTGPNSFYAAAASVSIPSASSSENGTYTVTVSNSLGCSATASVDVSILNVATPIVSNAPVCTGDSLKMELPGWTTYSWSGPAAFSAAVEDPFIANPTTSNSGVYSVTASIAGCTTTVTANLTVRALPIPTASSNQPVCVGTTLNLTSASASSYSWKGPNGFTSSVRNPNIAVTDTLPQGTYTLVVSNSFGCLDSTTHDVDVSFVVPTVKPSGRACLSASYPLTAGGGASYYWTGPNSFSSGNQNPSISNISLAKQGVYSVTITNADGCTASVTTSLTVSIPVATASSSSPVCEDDILVLTSSGGASYDWSGPRSFASNIQNPNISIVKQNQQGVYTVTVTDSVGCVATATTDVVINKNTNGRINDNGPICEGQNLELDGRGGDVYYWSGPNGFLSSLEDPIINSASAAANGTYTLQVTDSNGCSATVTSNITVYPSPIANPTATIADICVGQTLNLLSTVNDQYSWSGPNNFNSNQQNPIRTNATTNMSGVYTLTVTDIPENCSASASVAISINTIPPPPVSPAVSRCGTGTVTLTASGCSGVYQWYDTNSSSTVLGTGSSFTTPSLSSGRSYYVNCTEFTCPSSTRRQVQITILANPTATATVTQRHCVGSTAKFTGGGNNVSSYAWSGPLSWTSNEQSPTKLINGTNNGGTYTITTTRSNGCTATATTNLQVITNCDNICGSQYVIIPTNPLSCGSTNGQVYISATNSYETSLDGVNWTRGSVTYNNLGVGNYYFYVKDYATQNICKNVSNTLVSTTSSYFTGQSVTAASDCYSANGSITLQGVQPTDDVSWLATLKAPKVPVSSLSPSNTISNLTPGKYYVKVSRANDFCYAERYVDVPNNGTSCTSNTFCDDSTVPNLFPNGDFGSGANENGPVLIETQYGYSNYTCYAPWDGFYSITNNTDCDGNGGRAFSNQAVGSWDVLTEDHTVGDVNGYMMVINAGYTPNIVVEKLIGDLCPNTQYNFTAWMRNISPASTIQPDAAFIIDGVIKATSGAVTGNQWKQVGFSFKTGENTTEALFALRNIAPGGFGNNWILDDVKVSKCPLEINLSGTTIACLGGNSEEIEATINDPYEEYTYFKWEKSDDNGATWQNVTTVAQGSYVSGNMNVDLTLPTPIVSALSGRIYRIRLATTAATIDDPQCSVYSALTQIIVPPIELNVTLPIEKCIGSGSVALTATASGGTAPYSYLWRNSVGNTPTVNVNPSATTTYVVEAFDADNCPAIDSVIVTVKDQPTLTVTIEEDSVCLNGTTHIIAHVEGGSGNFQFTWYESADGSTNWTTIAGVTDSVYSPNTSVAGQKYFRVFVEDLTFDCNDATSNPVLFTVVPLPSVNINLSASPVCIGGAVNLTANVTSGAGAIEYQWYRSTNNTTFNALADDTLGTYSPNTGTAGTTYYEVEAVASASGCTAARSSSVAVQVLPNFDVDLLVNNAVVCIGGSAILTADTISGTGNITYQWFNSSDGVNFSSITGSTSTLTAPTGTTGITYYQVQATASGAGCGSATSTPTSVEVLPVFDVDVTVNNSPICIGGSVTLTADTSNGLGSVSYQWFGSLDNVTFNLIGGETNLSYNPSTTNSGTTYYRVEATASGSGCGTAVSDVVPVVVLPVFSVDVNPSSSVVCVGGTVSLDADTTNGTGTVTYQWQQSTNNVTFSNIAGATGETYNPSTATAGTLYYRVRATASGSGCGTVTSAGVSVEVLPVFEVSVTPSNTTLCLNGSSVITATTVSGTGTITYQWFNSTDNTTFSPISGATGATTTAPTTAVGTTYYRIVANASGNGCGNATSASAVVRVLPVFDVEVSLNNAVVCIGGNVTLTADTVNGTGTVTYQWLESTDNVSYTAISGATGVTYTANTASEGLKYYRVQATASGSGCGTVESDEVSVEVLPVFSVAVNPSSSTVCVGGAVTLDADPTNGTGTITYQWQESTNNSSFTNISGATNEIYTPSTSAEGTTYYRVIASATGAGCGSVTSGSSMVRVLPVFDVDIAIDNAVLCLGGSAVITADTSSGSGTVSYQWYNSTNNSTFTAISGATGDSIIVPTNAEGTIYYRVVATASGVGCGNATSASGSVEVLPVFDVDISVTNSIVCIGGAVNLGASPVNGTGTITYQWLESPDNSTFTAISGATNVNYVPNTATAGTKYYQVQATASGSGCGTVESDVATVRVLPIFSVDVNPSSSVVCLGGAVTLDADTTNGTGTVTYQWQESTNNSSFTNISGATNETYTPSTATLGTRYYRVIATATGAGCGSVTSGSVSVEVLPVFDVAIVVDNAIVCLNGAVTLTADTISGSGNVTYQWYNSSDGSTFAAISGATSKTLTAPTSSLGVMHYQIMANASGAGCGDATSASSTVTVEPQLIVELDQTSAEICLNESLTLQSTTSHGVGTITYQWQSSPDGSTWTNIVGQTNDNLSVSTSTAGLFYYRVLAFASGVGCNDATAVPTIVRIHDYPTVTRTFVSPLCEPTNGTITFTFSDEPAIDSIQFSLDNGLTYPYTTNDGAGTYTINGLGENVYELSAQYKGGLCPVSMTNVTMEERPAPSVTTTYVDPTCTTDNGTITFTFPDESTRTDIKFSRDGGTTYASNIADNSGSYTMNGVAPGIYNLFAIWGNDECPTDLGSVTLTDHPTPIITVSADTVLCEGQSYTISVSSTGGDNPITYTWDNGLGNALSHTVSPLVDTYYVVSVVDSNNCTVSDTVFVEVNPVPVVTATGGTFCEFDTLELSSTGVGIFEWTGPNTFTSSDQNPQIANGQLTDAGIYTVVLTNNFSCQSTATAELIVNDTPPSPSVVEGERCGPGVVNLSATGCNGNIEWYDSQFSYSSVSSGTNFASSNLDESKYFFVNCTTTLNCESIERVPVLAKVNELSVAQLLPINSTCFGNIAINNGQLIATRFEDGETFSFSEGSTYNSSTATSLATIPANGLLSQSINNPTTLTQSYTVRVNSVDGCPRDIVVEYQESCEECKPYCEPSSIERVK